jgi:hypothetical protein
MSQVQKAKQVRKAIRTEYRKEMREYYLLPFYTRFRLAWWILFKIYPNAK